jgi:hypothetical protein
MHVLRQTKFRAPPAGPWMGRETQPEPPTPGRPAHPVARAAFQARPRCSDGAWSREHSRFRNGFGSGAIRFGWPPLPDRAAVSPKQPHGAHAASRHTSNRHSWKVVPIWMLTMLPSTTPASSVLEIARPESLLRYA